MAKNNDVFKRLKHGLIVSCQALEDEPLYSSYIMSRMAYAAQEGGAVGIRANTPEDISEIKKAVDLPVIALYKKEYEDSDIYITPTQTEVEELMKTEPEIIAMDATDRVRPGNQTLAQFFEIIRNKYPDMLFMADCSCYEDGVRAQKLGFDLVGTTLCGYTKATQEEQIPNYNLIHQLSNDLTIPVIAEGGIWEIKDLKRVLDEGAYAAVIGTAITRPRDITRRFVKVIQENK